VGIAAPVAYALRLNLPIVLVCALLPDIIDKGLWALGIGSSRYIAHTLLFLFLVSLSFFLWKKAYGLSAFLGLVSHLLLDQIDGGISVPLFYPFIGYGFPEQGLEPGHFFSNLFAALEENFTTSKLIKELLGIISVSVLALLSRRLFLRFKKRDRKVKRAVTTHESPRKGKS
jgi:membrane-bound metal-dependent hydrolase YbcI (DUF457 family)